MAGFQTFQKGRFYAHILPTKQFKTRHISMKLSRSISRENATATALLSYLLMEGTKSYPTQKAILNYADDLYGASIRTGIGKRGDRHVLECNISIPEETSLKNAGGLFDKSLDLVFEVLGSPAVSQDSFLPEHVSREKTLHKKRIESIFDDKISFAMERCLQEMCEGSPVGISRLGYVEDIDSLTGTGLRSLHEELLMNADIHVYIIGNVEAESVCETVIQNLESLFGAERTATQATILEPFVRQRTEVNYVVDRESVSQGKLNLGFTTDVPYRSDDYPSLMVSNGILGGFPHSKLFTNVREKASLAYYASSRLDALSGILAIQTGIEVNNYDKALQIILEQVKALQNGEISDEELKFTQLGIRNQYLQLADQPHSMMDVHFSGVLAGVHREIPQLLESIEHVKKDDVVQMSQKLSLDTVYFLRSEEVTQGA